MKHKTNFHLRALLTASAAVLWAFTVAPANALTVVFEQNANGAAYSYPEGSGFFPNNNNWSQGEVVDGQSNVTAPSNWSIPAPPNSSSQNVLIDALSVTLNMTATIGSLTLSNGATVNVLNQQTLNISGNLTDNGTIVVNSNQGGNQTSLNFSGGTVSGTGTIVLNEGGSNGNGILAQLTGTLTQAAGHTISGQGYITAALTNNGLVNANVSGKTLILQSNTMTNNAVMEATAGGLLDISGITVNQGAGGQLLANGGNVDFDGVMTINGGALNSSGAGVFVVNSSTPTFASVTNNATVDVLNGQTLNISGNLTDNGTIVVNSNQGGNHTSLNFSGGTVSGTGTIVLNEGGSNGNGILAQLTGTLTQAAGHTISGQGYITTALTNNGLVNANVSGQTLTLQTSAMTNNYLMEATGGAVLAINAITVTQGTGGQLLAGGGNVQFGTSATITGGALSSSGSSVFIVNSGTVTFASPTNNSLINNATIDQTNGTTLNISGNLIENGTIVVNTSQSSNTTVLNFNTGATVSGTGAITLNGNGTYSQLNGNLTQAAGHTISGFGEINAAFINNGIVNANIKINGNSQTLTLQNTSSTNPTSMTNNYIMEATGGGLLDINAITITQGTAGQLLVNGGNVQFDGGATINGGSLSAPTNGGVFIVDSGTETFNSIANNATVNQVGAGNLTITGSLTNNGTIVVNSNDNVYNAAILSFTANPTLSGTGTIVLNDSGTFAQLNGTLTQAAGHTISGRGQINAALTNNGVVNANISGQTLTLQTSAMTNNNTMESTGGVLDINAITITQGTNGQLLANNGNIQFDGGATVIGGALNSSGSGVFIINTGTETFNSVTNNATVDLVGNGILNITGSLINNGTVVVNSNDNVYYGSTLSFGSGVTVSGTGAIVLYDSGAFAQLNGTLTQAAGHTISGRGQINAALTNNGVVNANVSGQTLTLQTSAMTNNNTMESTGGVLDINAIIITQGANGQLLTNGGNVQFDGSATVVGGTLNSSGSGVFIVNTGTETFNSVTNNAAVDLVGNSTLNITGSLINNGTVVVNSNDNVYYGSTLSFGTGVTVSGTGAIVLYDSGAFAQLNGTLTQAAGHTINGRGQINAALTNNGVVNANISGQTLTLQTSAMTNNNTMESTGGVLDINAITITQGTNGQLLANNGNIQFDGGATVIGGALNSSGSGVFIVNTGTETFNSVTNNAAVDLVGNSTLNITGSLINNGTVVVNSNDNVYYGSTLSFGTGVTVSGTGAIVLYDSGAFAQLNGTLTQAAGHTISGRGQINAALTNNGVVNASVNGQTLSVNGATSNAGLIEASNGGMLSIASGALTNLSGTTLTGGAYEANAGSTISLPGSISTNAATVTLSGTGSTFSAINGLANNRGSFSIQSGRNFTTAGALANSGTLVAGAGSTLTVNGALTQSSTGSLTGSGAFAATSFTLDGIVSPGDTVGSLTLTGTTNFLSTLDLDYDLGSVSGTNDHLKVTGNFTLAGTLEINGLAAGFGAGSYDLIDYSGGTFTNDTLAVGNTPAGFTYQIVTSTPGQVDLNVTALAPGPTPEPGSAALAFLGGLCLLARCRRNIAGLRHHPSTIVMRNKVMRVRVARRNRFRR